MLHFLSKTWQAITFSDAKFARSVIALLFKPGKLTFEYFSGRRKRYSAPLSLFFFVNLLYFLIPPVDAVNSTYASQVEGQFYSARAKEVALQKMAEKGMEIQEFEVTYNALTSQVSKLGLIFLVFLFALFYAIININKRDLFYKYLIAATHYVTFSVLSTLLIIPYIFWGAIWIYVVANHIHDIDINPNTWVFFFPLLSVLFMYGFVMQRRLFKEHILISILKSVLIPLGLVGSMFIYRALLFVVTIALI